MKRKICFVVQRYGLEVNGGAELLCREIAEKMTKFYEVHVLTTKAIDYDTWANRYLNDEEVINKVVVHRFPVEKERNQREFDNINGIFLQGGLTTLREDEWLKKQGPYVPKLIEYLRDHKINFDVFLFFTYLYYPTVVGVPEVQDRAIVFPLCHDEPFLRMSIYRNVFCRPKAFFFNMEQERKLVRHCFHNYSIPALIGGAGVDLPPNIDSHRFYTKFQVQNYIIYVGRIDEGKNCSEMFDFFLRYKKQYPSDLKLVLVGKPMMKIPKDKDILSLGFVSDQEKYDGIDGAKFLLLPSIYESLSIVVLEALSLKKPVLLNGKCEVLKAHIEGSKAGYFYSSYDDFSARMTSLLSDKELRISMGESGKRYVDTNFKWSVILRKLNMLIEYVVSSNTIETSYEKSSMI